MSGTSTTPCRSCCSVGLALLLLVLRACARGSRDLHHRAMRGNTCTVTVARLRKDGVILFKKRWSRAAQGYMTECAGESSPYKERSTGLVEVAGSQQELTSRRATRCTSDFVANTRNREHSTPYWPISSMEQLLRARARYDGRSCRARGLLHEHDVWRSRTEPRRRERSFDYVVLGICHEVYPRIIENTEPVVTRGPTQALFRVHRAVETDGLSPLAQPSEGFWFVV